MPAEAVTWAALAVAIGSVLSLIGFWTRYRTVSPKPRRRRMPLRSWRMATPGNILTMKAYHPIALSDSPRCHRSHNSVFRGRRKPSTKALIHRHTPSFPFKIKLRRSVEAIPH